MPLFPKKIDFFEHIARAVSNAVKTADRLAHLMDHFEEAEEIVHEIHELEQEGDLITHDIIRNLHKSFITPIDREDLHTLATRIDDIVDLIWACVDKMIVFRFEKPTKDAQVLAREIYDTTIYMQKAFKELEGKNYERVKEHCIEVNRMENRIDRIYRNALGDLFDEFKDAPLMVIKWKDIYERLEDCADKCEDVANVLEGVVLKHG